MCYQAKGLNAQPKQADPFVFASSFLQAVEMVDTSITGVNVDTLPSKRKSSAAGRANKTKSELQMREFRSNC